MAAVGDAAPPFPTRHWHDAERVLPRAKEFSFAEQSASVQDIECCAQMVSVFRLRGTQIALCTQPCPSLFPLRAAGYFTKPFGLADALFDASVHLLGPKGTASGGGHSPEPCGWCSCAPRDCLGPQEAFKAPRGGNWTACDGSGRRAKSAEVFSCPRCRSFVPPKNSILVPAWRWFRTLDELSVCSPYMGRGTLSPCTCASQPALVVLKMRVSHARCRPNARAGAAGKGSFLALGGAGGILLKIRLCAICTVLRRSDERIRS